MHFLAEYIRFGSDHAMSKQHAVPLKRVANGEVDSIQTSLKLLFSFTLQQYWKIVAVSELSLKLNTEYLASYHHLKLWCTLQLRGQIQSPYFYYIPVCILWDRKPNY